MASVVHRAQLQGILTANQSSASAIADAASHKTSHFVAKSHYPAAIFEKVPVIEKGRMPCKNYHVAYCGVSDAQGTAAPTGRAICSSRWLFTCDVVHCCDIIVHILSDC